MTVSHIYLQYHVGHTHPGILVKQFLSGFRTAHRVNLTHVDQDRQILTDFLRIHTIRQFHHHREEILICPCSEHKAAEWVSHVFINDHLILRQPVVVSARRFERLIISAENHAGQQLAGMVPASRLSDQVRHHSACFRHAAGNHTGSHDDCSCQLIAVMGNVSPGHKRTHTVAEDKQRLSVPSFLSKHGNTVHILHHEAMTILICEISLIRFTVHGFSVSQMIMTNHRITMLCQKCSKIMIPVNVLTHTVHQLNYSLDLRPLRLPDDPVKLCLPIT